MGNEGVHGLEVFVMHRVKCQEKVNLIPPHAPKAKHWKKPVKQAFFKSLLSVFKGGWCFSWTEVLAA